MVRLRVIDSSVQFVIALLALGPIAAFGQSIDSSPRSLPVAPPSMTSGSLVAFTGSERARELQTIVAIGVNELRTDCSNYLSERSLLPRTPRGSLQPASGIDLPAEVQLCAYVLNPNTTVMEYWLQGGLLGAAAAGFGAVVFLLLRMVAFGALRSIARMLKPRLAAAQADRFSRHQ